MGVIPLPTGETDFASLDGFISAAKQMQHALGIEREKNRRLQEELNHALRTYDRLIKESQSKANEVSAAESRAKARLSEVEENHQRMEVRHGQLLKEFHKLRDELAQYRAAWSDVLQREREAKTIIRESELRAKRIADVEAHNKTLQDAAEGDKKHREQLERHARSYKTELQNALVRLHSAEARFSEVSKEMQILTQARKTMSEEVAKIEQSMKERFQFQLAQEREKLRAEMERSFADEREKLRKQQLETQTQLVSEAFREASTRARAEAQQEIERERQHIAQRRDILDLELQKAQTEATRMRIEADKARAEADDARAKSAALSVEIEKESVRSAILQKDNAQLRIELETVRATPPPAPPAPIIVDNKENEALKECIRKLEAELAHERRKLREIVLSTERKIDAVIASERRRASEQLARVIHPRSPQFLDRLRVAESRADLQRYVAEAKNFELAFESECERTRSLEGALVAEKARFDEMAALLETEVERLQSAYPLKDLLDSKEFEITEIKGAMQSYQLDFAERLELESSLKTLERQRENLRNLVATSERRLEEQLKRIKRATQVNTILAGPDENPDMSGPSIVADAPAMPELDDFPVRVPEC